MSRSEQKRLHPLTDSAILDSSPGQRHRRRPCLPQRRGQRDEAVRTSAWSEPPNMAAVSRGRARAGGPESRRTCAPNRDGLKSVLFQMTIKNRVQAPLDVLY